MPTSRPERSSGPRRTCVGCRTVRAQEELIRVARTDAGTLEIGRTLPGRGAWLCHGSLPCLEQAIKRNGFSRAFRSPVSAAVAGELRSAVAEATTA